MKKSKQKKRTKTRGVIPPKKGRSHLSKVDQRYMVKK